MNKFALIALVVLSMATVAEAKRKSAKNNPDNQVSTSDTCNPAYGACSEEELNSDDQSSDDNYTSQSGTFEGNDRDTGSDYINGMPY